MATAAKTESKPKATKSPIPKRILTRIDAAFGALDEAALQITPADESVKALKKVERDKKDVLVYIEGLLTGSSD